MRRFLIEFTFVLLRLGHGQMNYTPPSQPPRPTADKASSLAVMTLLAGIASWTVLPFLGGFLGIVFGLIELGNIKKGQSPEAGKLITQIGFYASIANIVLSILGTCAIFALYFGIFGLALGGAALEGVGH